jgi:cobalt-zinc-cadmium efflux system outer membrane protein
MASLLLSASVLTAWGQEADAMKRGEAEAVPTTSFTVWANEMQTIARNNTTLKAMHAQLQATLLANSADNALPDPEAEVAYMFGSPKGVEPRTNVAVTQSLDWGVLTGRRRKLSKAANTAAMAEYRVAFQKVMSEADAALVQMVYYNRLQTELETRCHEARNIMLMYEKKYTDGDINLIELNKVRLNTAVSEAELQRAKADRAAVAQTLQRLNGGAPIAMPDTVYPATTALPPLATLKEAMPHTAAMAQAEASLAQSTAAVKLAKVEGMPEFTVGFQGEYIKDNNYSGPSIGLSIPLWGNTRRKVKAARATQVASQLSLADARQQQLSTLDQLYMQATDLNATTQQLKDHLAATTNDALLRRSLEAGQLSVLNYILEQSFYYSARTALLEAERDAQLAVSQVRALMY